MNSSITINEVMNYGAEVHTVEFRYFRKIKKKKKTRKHIHNLKTCTKWILVPIKIYFTISKPCITPEPWNRQHSNSGSFRVQIHTKLIVVGLFNSPTTMTRLADALYMPRWTPVI